MSRGRHIGLLWFLLEGKGSLEQQVLAGIERYQEKFGKMPVLCHVHISLLPEVQSLDKDKVGVSFEVSPYVLPRHLFFTE